MSYDWGPHFKVNKGGQYMICPFQLWRVASLISILESRSCFSF